MRGEKWTAHARSRSRRLGGGFVAVCGKPGRLARDTIAFLDDDVDNHQAELD